ncbi:unnamed protein product [Tuber melanosporum]|uniref:(Perigord truffle) hypothetical protein n=1 Tax=Tuber melanosporum (strain Mel28) TaxID=656061 RepID=D5GIJ3_TUBMM|nr:uncharacterized protein GSTUM_00008525001 [Tuber melanosporum]CAZ84336.1 unnamed protein product [Tuber melanosporum]
MPYPSPSLQPQRRSAQHSNNTSPPATQHTQMIQPPQFNAFPTSPFSNLAHLPAPCRQLHPPKSPLYRPAVLRSIERPVRRENSPLTPPTSSAASVNEEYVGDGEYKNGMDIRSAGYGGYLGGEDFGIVGLEEEGKVTGPPGKGHWKPDAEAVTCDAVMCVKNFSFVLRRHHCRRCGNVFCAQHTAHTVPLNQNARFHIQGYQERACDNCWNDYTRLLDAKRTDSLSSSNSSGSTLSNNHPSPSSPVMNMGVRGTGPGNGRGMDGLGAKVGSYVGSVPRDWSWSTF